MFYLIQDDCNTVNVTSQIQDLVDTPLKNEKFGWREAKHKNEKLKEILELGGDAKGASRAKWCSSGLEFNFLEALDDGSNLKEAVTEGKKQLSSGMFCQMRICPVCNSRRSAKLAVMLSECLQKVKEAHPNVRFIFLTLTQKNVKGEALSDEIDALMKAFHRLMNRKPVKRAVKGVFRTLEITYNMKQDTYHPHFHLLLAVENDEYFGNGSGGMYYITREKWQEFWRQSMRLAYTPLIDVRVADRDKRSWGKVSAELTKYAVKDSDYLKVADRYGKKRGYEVVKTFMDALFKRRLIQASGWFKDFWNEKAEEDLMHIEGDGEKHSLYYGHYGYNFGKFRDYFLKMVYTKNEGHIDKIVLRGDWSEDDYIPLSPN